MTCLYLSIYVPTLPISPQPLLSLMVRIKDVYYAFPVSPSFRRV
jgi:hypothetical protein